MPLIGPVAQNRKRTKSQPQAEYCDRWFREQMGDEAGQPHADGESRREASGEQGRRNDQERRRDPSPERRAVSQVDDCRPEAVEKARELGRLNQGMNAKSIRGDVTVPEPPFLEREAVKKDREGHASPDDNSKDLILLISESALCAG